jgi:hypothetical protein
MVSTPDKHNDKRYRRRLHRRERRIRLERRIHRKQCIRNRYRRCQTIALYALQTSVPTHIREVVPDLINGKPSNDVLDMLKSMVSDDNCANTSMDILRCYCGAIGLKIAHQINPPTQ